MIDERHIERDGWRYAILDDHRRPDCDGWAFVVGVSPLGCNPYRTLIDCDVWEDAIESGAHLPCQAARGRLWYSGLYAGDPAAIALPNPDEETTP